MRPNSVNTNKEACGDIDYVCTASQYPVCTSLQSRLANPAFVAAQCNSYCMLTWSRQMACSVSIGETSFAWWLSRKPCRKSHTPSTTGMVQVSAPSRRSNDSFAPGVDAALPIHFRVTCGTVRTVQALPNCALLVCCGCPPMPCSSQCYF